MKWIKLFENFTEENNLSVEGVLKRKEYANEVLEDIKSISYILEDEGFELKYQFSTLYGDNLIEDYNRWTNNGNLEIGVGNLESIMIDSIVVKVIGNSIIDPHTFQRVFNEDKLKSIERYINLLKEHLDYINPDNINQGRSLMGGINIKIKL